MKKKVIIRIVAVVLLLATVVTGGAFFAPNKEAEATTYIRPCAHTKIEVKLNTTSKQGLFSIETAKGGSKHTHAQQWYWNNSNQMTTLDTFQTSTWYNLTTGQTQTHSYKTHAQYWINTHTTQTQTESRFTGKIKTNQSHGYGFYDCPDCHLYRASPDGIITVRPTCCNKTVRINSRTGKVL